MLRSFPVRRRSAAAAIAVAAAGALLATAGPAAADNPPGPHDPFGVLNHLGVVTAADGGLSVHAVGWGADPDTPTANASVLSLVDGRIVASTPTSIARPRISSQHGLGPTPGFAVDVPVPDSSPHTVCIAVNNTRAGLATVLGCTGTPSGTPVDDAAHSPVGAVESATATASSMTVSGWTADPDFRARRSVVVLYVDGTSVATVTTHAATAAERTAGSSPRGAFSITVPVAAGSHLGCIWVVNVGFGSNSSLGCSALTAGGTVGTAPVSVPAANNAAANEALTHVGGQYSWGAAGPTKFDCSGLVMYSYGKAHLSTPRIAADQFAAATVIPASRAVRGDLVFYHDGVGNVYHVGIYLSPGKTVAAIDDAEGINYQTIWDPSSATYGSFTHN